LPTSIASQKSSQATKDSLKASQTLSEQVSCCTPARCLQDLLLPKFSCQWFLQERSEIHTWFQAEVFPPFSTTG